MAYLAPAGRQMKKNSSQCRPIPTRSVGFPTRRFRRRGLCCARSFVDTSATQRAGFVRYPMKIFLVEDSPHVCEHLKELIGSEGHSILGCADNYDAAVEGIASTRPDVGIFDIHLKRGNGIDALAEAKRLLPRLVGIVMSNDLTPQHRVLASEAGALAVLDKSGEFERIPEILAGLSVK